LINCAAVETYDLNHHRIPLPYLERFRSFLPDRQLSPIKPLLYPYQESFIDDQRVEKSHNYQNAVAIFYWTTSIVLRMVCKGNA
jgi:hypothetical protein